MSSASSGWKLSMILPPSHWRFRTSVPVTASLSGRWDGQREGWSRTQRRSNSRPPRTGRAAQVQDGLAGYRARHADKVVPSRLCPLPGLSLISRLKIPVKPLDCCCSPSSVSTAKRLKSLLTRYGAPVPGHANGSHTYGLKLDLPRRL